MHTISIRFFSALLGLVAAGHLLQAGETTVPVTPQTLAAWTVVGEAPSSAPGADVLVLPVGAQLVRSFATSRLSVDLTTRPVFGAEPDQSPVLEVGSVALVFMRNGQSGTLALVVDQADPVMLSVLIGLDTDGRSIEPLVISLGQADGIVTVTAGGSTQRFPLVTPAADPSAVVISSGSTSAWDFEQLSVSTFTSDARGGESRVTSSGTSGGRSSGTTAKPAGATTTEDAPGSGPAAAVTTGSVGSVPDQAPAATVSTLEVFTPPAVRHGRSDAARAAAFEGKRN